MIKSPNPSTDDAVTECLATAINVASHSPSHHRQLLQRMLHEISVSDGVVRAALTNAFVTDDADTVLRLARIYGFTGVGNSELIASSFHKSRELKELLPIMIRLTGVPFDAHDDARGLNGIAEQTLEFWEVLAVAIGRTRQQFTKGISDDSLAPALTDPVEIGEAVEQQNVLFDLVLRTLLGQCLLPTPLLNGSDGNDEFYQ